MSGPCALAYSTGAPSQCVDTGASLSIETGDLNFNSSTWPNSTSTNVCSKQDSGISIRAVTVSVNSIVKSHSLIASGSVLFTNYSLNIYCCFVIVIFL